MSKTTSKRGGAKDITLRPEMCLNREMPAHGGFR